MRNCPRCDVEIGESAIGCKCGWRDRQSKTLNTPTEHIDCAHHACVIKATIRYRLVTGWANLCYSHYISEIRKEQDKRMDAKGFKRGNASDLARAVAEQKRIG